MWPVVNSIVVDTARSATPTATIRNCFGPGQANTFGHKIIGMARRPRVSCWCMDLKCDSYKDALG